VSGQLILIVEDNARNAKLLRDVLQVSGYRTIDTTTAEDGIAVARRDRPDLILMDIQLPGMDGKAALRELRAQPETAHIPVIAVTASVMPLERKDILAHGFDGFQGKPLSVHSLLDEVRRIFEEQANSAR
jgi:two-component system, cell cycle response regulator DivK